MGFMTQFAVSRVPARSLSRGVWQELRRVHLSPQVGKVSAVFERAFHVDFCSDEPVAVVSPDLGDGPLNIVLGERPGALPPPGVLVQVCPGTGRLAMGQLEITLEGAAIWEPRPNWERLRSQVAAIQDRLPRLATLVLSLAPPDSLASILTPVADGQWTSRPATIPVAGQQWADCVGSAVADALGLLFVGLAADGPDLRVAASRLAGLGRGLTPSGDDLLIGIMIWAWLADPAPERICRPLLAGSHQRTTAWSAALLRAAGRGECSLAWHHLLETLQGHSDGEVAAAVHAVLDVGHTSGADALAGFIWMGLHARQP